MDQATLSDRQLAQERNLKYRGTARVYIDQIVLHQCISRELDPKNVKRLSEIFTQDRCRRLDTGNHITAVVSEQYLAVALQTAGLTIQDLRTCQPENYPLLNFPGNQLQCLHGQHRLAAGKNHLVPSEQWWTVDIYLDNISPPLLTALVDEYSNEKVPSDGEVFLKVRQYEAEGNAHFERRWIARISPNKAKRLRQLSSRLDIRAAFDRLRTIPALLLQGMKIGSLPRVLATSCDEEIVRALDTLLLGWSGILGHNTASMLKLDPETIDKLQGRAPGVSSQDATEVEGLVLSGAVFPKFSLSERTDIWGRLKEHNGLIWSLNSFFQDMWYLEACANCMKRLVVPSRDHPTIRSSFMRIYDPDHSSNEYPVQTTETTAPLRPCSQLARAELGYRQLWLYAQRHYPKIPRESEDENLTTRVNPEKADIILLCTMAQLALRLRFFSPRIQGLAGLSPDRQMARDVLLKARRPEYFQYKSDTFEDLVTQITQCFNQAVLVNHQTSLEPVASREPKPKSRCGLPLARDQKQDSRFLFLDTLHGELQHDGKVSTLFIRQCVDFTFFGKLPDEVYIPANVPPNLQGDSLLFVPQNDALPASTPELSRTEGLTEDLANDVAKDLARNRGKNPGRDRDKNRGKDRGKDRDGNQAKGRDTDRGQRGIEKGRPKRKLRRRAKASSDAETEYSSMSTDDAPKPQEPSQTEMEGVTQDAAGIHPPVNQSVTGQEYSHNVHQAQSEAAITEPNAMGLVEQSGLPQTQSNRDSIITTVDFEVLPEAPSHTGETQSNLEQRPDERQSSVVTEVPEDDVDDQLSDVLGVDGQHREIGNGHPTQKAPQPVDPARAKALAQLNNPRSPPHTHPAGESTRPRREVTRMHLSKVIENESERDQANIIHVNHSNRRAKDQHVRFDAPHAETDRTARAPEAGAQEVTPGQGARPVTRVDFASIPTVERSKPTPQSSRQDVGQVGRKVLKPRKTATNNSSPDQRLPEMVTVVFGIEGEDGEWQNRDEVTVHRSDPSAVEQKAKDFARAYQATFYTRESRNITPGQCFEAAMEDREHRIWMRWNNYETDDEL